MGEGKGNEEEINFGPQDAVCDANCGIIKGLPKNARELALICCHSMKCDKVKENNDSRNKKI